MTGVSIFVIVLVVLVILTLFAGVKTVTVAIEAAACISMSYPAAWANR